MEQFVKTFEASHPSWVQMWGSLGVAGLAVLVTSVGGTWTAAHSVVSGNLQYVRDDVTKAKNDISDMKQDLHTVRSDVAILKQDVAVLKQDVAEIKQDMAYSKKSLETSCHHKQL